MENDTFQPRRSFIFMPGIRPEMYPKARARTIELFRAPPAADLGFTGKGSIHPKQIAPLNAIFSPGKEAVEHARRVVRAFEAADSGLVVLDNKLIEKPVLRDMYRILRIAERIGG